MVFWHSLEHLPSPGDAIRQAARLLLPGGVVVIAVPNNSSVQAQAFGDHWLHLDMPRHLAHLSTESLRRGLRDSGFKVERVSFVRGGQIMVGWLQGLVGLLPGQPDLYQALRREGARGVDQPASTRLLAVAAGVVLAPVAAVASGAEIALRSRGHRLHGSPHRLNAAQPAARGTSCTTSRPSSVTTIVWRSNRAPISFRTHSCNEAMAPDSMSP